MRPPVEAAAELEAELRAGATPDRAVSEKAYLKSDLDFIGATQPVIRQAAKGFKRAHPKATRDEVVAVCDVLWARPVHELKSVAIALLELDVKRLGPDDLPRLEAMMAACNTWAHLDWLAVKVAGPLTASRPDVLERWAVHPNFWVRRASLLAQLDALKVGRGDFALFSRLAGGMVHEKEFFIRKAIGWVLREVSKKHPAQTTAFLKAHARAVSGLTLREGARYLPEADRVAIAQAR